MANTRYQLEGNAPQLYERETVHTLGRPLAELMFAHVTLQAGDRVLDAACGTGIVTRVAAQRFRHLAHIMGLDLNPGMLDVAQAHTPTTGVPVEWRQGDLSALPFPKGQFDVVLCQQGLQFVPDPGTALREMHRVLVPGGRLAFTVFREVPVYYAILADALARHVSAAAATSCLSRYTLQDATTLRMLVEAAGFSAMTRRVLMASLRPHEWEQPCWRFRWFGHPPAQYFLVMTIQELAIHGWDLRAGLEPCPRLSGACVPVLVERAMQRFRLIPQLASFRLSTTQPAPVRYRFEVRGEVPGTYDFVVEEAQVHLEPAGAAVANATFRCETDTFILMMYKRLTLHEATAAGRVSADGESGLIADFDQWLRGA